MKHQFPVLIEKCEDGGYFARVPALRSCYTSADTIPELMKNVREVIDLCIDVEMNITNPGYDLVLSEFVGVQLIEVDVPQVKSVAEPQVKKTVKPQAKVKARQVEMAV